MAGKIICDKCSSDQVYHALKMTEPPVTMTEYIRKQREPMPLVLRRATKLLRCPVCGYEVEYDD